MAEKEPNKAEAEPGQATLSKPPENHEKEKEPAQTEKNSSYGDSIDRDAVLTKVETEKRLALIKAWEENEKAKVDNRAYKRFSAIGSWENRNKAYVEEKLRKFEEKLEKKKSEYAERMKNKMAEIRKAAEEKRAMAEAKRGEHVLKIEETAAKFVATGYTPRKFLACFSG